MVQSPKGNCLQQKDLSPSPVALISPAPQGQQVDCFTSNSKSVHAPQNYEQNNYLSVPWSSCLEDGKSQNFLQAVLRKTGVNQGMQDVQKYVSHKMSAKNHLLLLALCTFLDIVYELMSTHSFYFPFFKNKQHSASVVVVDTKIPASQSPLHSQCSLLLYNNLKTLIKIKFEHIFICPF